MSRCHVCKTLEHSSIIFYSVLFLLSRLCSLMCFYLYVSLYSYKSFRGQVVLSTAVPSLQTVFLLVMEFLEYHGFFLNDVQMGNITEFYHWITSQMQSRRCFPTFTQSLNSMVFSEQKLEQKETVGKKSSRHGQLNVRAAVGSCYRRPVWIPHHLTPPSCHL